MHFCLERSFSGDPVFRTGKFPLNYRWTQVVVKDSKVVFSFFPVWVYVTIGDKSFIYVAVGVYR